MSKIRNAINDVISKPVDDGKGKTRAELYGHLNYRRKENYKTFISIWHKASKDTDEDKILVDDLAELCKAHNIRLESDKGKYAYEGRLPKAATINAWQVKEKTGLIAVLLKDAVDNGAKPDNVKAFKYAMVAELKQLKDKEQPKPPKPTLGVNDDWLISMISS